MILLGEQLFFSDVTGINDLLMNFLIQRRGSKFGVILVDYFGHDLRLVKAALGWDTSSAIHRLFISRVLVLLLLSLTTLMAFL